MSLLQDFSDEQLIEQLCTGKLPPHNLEQELGDCERAVRVRRGWIERDAHFDATALPYKRFDYASVLGACAEMVIGYVPLPVGVAGPLLLNGARVQVGKSVWSSVHKGLGALRTCASVAWVRWWAPKHSSEYQCAATKVPMATVEGTLIASTRRGCKAITESGGASAAVLQHAMTRAPVLLFPSAMRAAAFKAWVEVNSHRCCPV